MNVEIIVDVLTKVEPAYGHQDDDYEGGDDKNNKEEDK